MREPNDQNICELIFELEEELLAEGLEPKERHFQLPAKAMERLGYSSFSVAGPHVPELLTRIREIHDKLYRRSDVAIGGSHGGAFMFRGIAGAVRIPWILGRAKIFPFDHSDFSPQQIEWLQSDPGEAESYLSTFSDLFDFSACLTNLGGYQAPPAASQSWFRLAAFQIQGAAAALCAAFDGRGAIQSSLMGVELSLKAALVGKGKTAADLKAYGHKRLNLVEEVGRLYGTFELASVKSRMASLPELVPNRYSPNQPSRMKTGAIVMASQYIAGAVARAVTGGNFRTTLTSRL